MSTSCRDAIKCFETSTQRNPNGEKADEAKRAQEVKDEEYARKVQEKEEQNKKWHDQKTGKGKHTNASQNQNDPQWSDTNWRQYWKDDKHNYLTDFFLYKNVLKINLYLIQNQVYTTCMFQKQSQ